MLFNSPIFILFLIVILGVYYSLPQSYRKLALLASGISFYSFWDWRFAVLLGLSTGLDYLCAQKIEDSKEIWKKRFFLFFSVSVSLSILGFFKYFQFAYDNLSHVFGWMGLPLATITFQIILPVGLSFCTLQSIGYVIDVARGHAKAARSPVLYANFISFFPQLVAGPIDKANELMPQLAALKSFDRRWLRPALVLIIMGFIKKVWIGDPLAMVTDEIFLNSHEKSAFDLWIGAISFSSQVYFDFSGYSDIARGLAQLFGVTLINNFRQPFLCTSPRDLWSKWHISLNLWVQSYLYHPMGGSRVSRPRAHFNTVFAMTVIGLWHGATWNFVFFGFFHGVSITLERIFFPKFKPNKFTAVIGGTYAIVVWLVLSVFFRATSLEQATSYIRDMWTRDFNVHPQGLSFILLLAVVYFLIDGITKWKGEFFILKTSWVYQYFFFFLGIAVTLFLLFNSTQRPFVYFQF